MDQYGSPGETEAAAFIIPKYGMPKNLPKIDEVWTYPMQRGHRLVCFKDGRVVLAIEEWSDF